MDKTRHIASLSAEASLLIDRLRNLEVNEVVGYNDLSKIVGAKVDGSYGPLIRAKVRVLHDDGIVIDTVCKVGVKRLADDDVVLGVAERDRDRIRRTARRGLQKQEVVKYDRLSNENKLRWNANVSYQGIVASMSTARQMKKLEAAVGKVDSRLSLADTLEAFRNGSTSAEEK
jgi:hypothetical protein